MKYLHDFLYEKSKSKSQKGLVVVPKTNNDFKKLEKWLDKSDFYGEKNNIEKFYFFPEEDTDSLEKELEKEFIKNDINVTYELQESNSLKEKAYSMSQQALMAVALQVREGDMKLSEVEPAGFRDKVKELVDSDITNKQLRDFAETKKDELKK